MAALRADGQQDNAATCQRMLLAQARKQAQKDGPQERTEARKERKTAQGKKGWTNEMKKRMT